MASELQRGRYQYEIRNPCVRLNGSLRSSIYLAVWIIIRNKPETFFERGLDRKKKGLFQQFTGMATLYCPPPGTVIALMAPALAVVRTEITGRAMLKVRTRRVCTYMPRVPIRMPAIVRTDSRFAAFKYLQCRYGIVEAKRIEISWK